jgi:hypothetical protein
VAEGEQRVIVVVNAARGYWQDGNYGLWVGGGGSFKQIYCSQVLHSYRYEDVQQCVMIVRRLVQSSWHNLVLC